MPLLADDVEFRVLTGVRVRRLNADERVLVRQLGDVRYLLPYPPEGPYLDVLVLRTVVQARYVVPEQVTHPTGGSSNAGARHH